MLDRAAVRRRTGLCGDFDAWRVGARVINALVFAFRYFYYLKKDLEKVSDKTRTRAFA